MIVRDLVILFFVRRWILILQYRRRNLPALAAQSSLFHGPDLERIDSTHPLSGLRIARGVRAAGLVDFHCVSRHASRYEITAVFLERISDELKERKAKWAGSQILNARELLQEAFIMEGLQPS